MSSGDGGTIGYKYFMGIHMGVSRGPVDELVIIKVGDRVAWPIGVGENPPVIPNTATVPSNTFPFEIIPWTDYEGTPHPKAGYIRLTVAGAGFPSEFVVGKNLTVVGSTRTVRVPYLDDGGLPYTIDEVHSVDGSYPISFVNNVNQLVIDVVDYPEWGLMHGVILSYESPTVTYTVPYGDIGEDDTARGYPADVSKEIYINAPSLFGGKKGEGGVKGPCDVMMGEPTQAVNLDLKDMLGATVLSAFRGMFTLFFDGYIAAFNPYPKEWKFRVRRSLKGWADDIVFYPEKCRIDITLGASLIRSMNGAHIIYECLTNPDWARGMDPAYIDVASFTAAADTLFTEGFGLCLKWSRQDTIDEFIQLVIDHIGAVMYVSKVTNLLTLKLIRADYDVETIPAFTRLNGVITVIEDQSTSAQPLVNEVVVKFKDPRTGDDAAVRAQNLAMVQAYGSIISDTVQYPGIPTAALANRVALRDLRIKGLPLRRMKLSFDRRAYNLEPGAVFKYSDSSRGIGNVVLRVGRVEDGTQGDSTIEVTCIEDVFGLSASSYLGSPDLVIPPVNVALPAQQEILFEMSYYDWIKFLPGVGIGAGVGYVAASASRATLVHQDFSINSSTNPTELVERGSSSFRAGGTLIDAIAFNDIVVDLEDVVEANLVVVGSAALIGDEIVRIDSFNSSTSQIVISRGCVDTLPKAHAAGTPVVFYNRFAAVDTTAYAEAEIVYAKLITRTNSGELSSTLATQLQTTIVGRAGRPYPPGNVRINGVQYGFPMEFPPQLVVTWAHRNKVTQAELLVSQTEASVAPPGGLTYTIQVYDAGDDSLLREVTGLTGETWEYTPVMWFDDGGVESVYLKLISVQGGEESWLPYIMPVTIQPIGWGNKWGMAWGSLV